MIWLHYESKIFTVTMICNQIPKKRWECDSKEYKASLTDKDVTPYVNVHLRSKSCLFFEHVLSLILLTSVLIYKTRFLHGNETVQYL